MSTNIRINQESLLRKLAERRKLSHAYVFSGNDEAQKNQLVADLIAYLDVQIADQVFLEPAQDEITISQIRDLSSILSMTAWSSPYKVALLRSAHTMNREAQSAFLKLLEEPKGDTVFFLLCEYPDMLLDTIRSRAQEFKFYSFAPREVPHQTVLEFQKLQSADLVARFAYAKRLADTPEQILAALESLLLVARQLLHAAVKENVQTASSLVATIKTIQETSVLLRTTNVNPRLALERIMLNL